MTPKSKAKEPQERSIGGLVVSKAQAATEPLSMLIYGPPKVGKTYLAGSIIEVPGFERVLLIDIDAGSASIARAYPNVDVVTPELNDPGTVSALLTELAESEDSLGYDAVILDTFSILSTWAINAIADGKKPEWDHWGTFATWATDTMWELHRMKALGITTFHTQTKENKLTKELRTTPKIQGSAATAIGAVPDLIGYMSIVEKGNGDIIRTLRVHPGEQIEAGNRFDDLPDIKLADPTMSELFEFIRTGEAEAAPPSLAERAVAQEGDAADTDAE